MSRKERTLKKRYEIFCEGDTEYNYTDKMRKNQGVELVLKPINMHGGGYSNFLKQIKKEAQTNFLAKFIIVDADRILNDSKEKEYFRQLLEYCRIQNDKGNTPIFIIANNPDFEYVACLHDEDYKGQSMKSYITKVWGYRDLDEFKKDPDIYNFLNTGNKSYQNMLSIIRKKDKLICNKYDVKKKTFDIKIHSTEFKDDLLDKKTSNIDEFFDVIEW